MTRGAAIATVFAVVLGTIAAPPAMSRAAVERAAGMSAPHAAASLLALAERPPLAAVRDPRHVPAAPRLVASAVRPADVSWRARPGRRPDAPDRPLHRKRPLPRGATADPTVAD